MPDATLRCWVCRHVRTDKAPVQAVRCADDGVIWVLCAAEDGPDDFAPMAWGCVMELEPSLQALQVCLQPGYRAERRGAGSAWHVHPIAPQRYRSPISHALVCPHVLRGIPLRLAYVRPDGAAPMYLRCGEDTEAAQDRAACIPLVQAARICPQVRGHKLLLSGCPPYVIYQDAGSWWVRCGEGWEAWGLKPGEVYLWSELRPFAVARRRSASKLSGQADVALLDPPESAWVLEDCEERHRQSPVKFELLPEPIRRGLCVGDHAKLIFLGPEGGERMWVCVTIARADDYEGTLANDPIVIEGLAYGDPVVFAPKHIAQVLPVDRRTLWRTCVCRHVTEEAQPVLAVQCDEVGQVHARCGRQDEQAHPLESMVSEAWGWLVRRDPSLGPLTTDLSPGVWCERSATDGVWKVEKEGSPPGLGVAQTAPADA